MQNDDFRAFEVASGLLTEAEKQTIKKTAEFEKSLKKWQLHLHQLNVRAPLNKKSADKIWQAINQQIKAEKPSLISTWLRSWRYGLSSFAGLSVVISAILFNQTANAKLDWDIHTDFEQQKLIIITTTHEHIYPAKDCTLWVKKNDKIYRIGLMPETGRKHLKINQMLSEMIKGGELIISLESKKSLASEPTKIQYQQQWKS